MPASSSSQRAVVREYSSGCASPTGLVTSGCTALCSHLSRLLWQLCSTRTSAARRKGDKSWNRLWQKPWLSGNSHRQQRRKNREKN